MSQEAQAKARAAEKARHKGLSLQPTTPDGQEELADAGSSTPAASSPAPAPAADNTKSYKDLPASIRNTYDKQLLLRRSKLQRLQYSRRALHHYDLSAPKHTDATRDARRLRTHPKGSKGKPDPREPKEPRAPAELAPAADPTPPAPAPASAKPAPASPTQPAKQTLPAPTKNGKQKPPKAPKPDPTQPPTGDH